MAEIIARDDNERPEDKLYHLPKLTTTDQECQSLSSEGNEDWRNSSSEEMPSPCSGTDDTTSTTDAEVEELCSEGAITTDLMDMDTNRMNDVVTPPLPEGCVPLVHQVAGHIHGKGKTKAGLLQYHDGTILKPIQTNSRGKKERQFYCNVTEADTTVDRILTGLRPFVPRYYGTHVNPDYPELVYLKLDDVTKRFRKPCIMDVKIGLQSYEEGAPPEKKKQAMLKYPYLKSVGFQILGMRVFHPATGEYEYKDKYYGRKLDQNRVIEGLARYLNVGESFRLDVLVELLQQLEQINDWFENQQKYHFFSSSLLFVYEGDITSLNINNVHEGDITLLNGDGLHQSKGDATLVSYSKLAISDSESILAASRNLSTAVDNSVDPIGDGEQGVAPSSECMATHLPTYRESQQQQVGGGGDGIHGAILPPSFHETNQRGRMTVAQMRDKQRQHVRPVSNQPENMFHNGCQGSDNAVNGSTTHVNGAMTKPRVAEIKMIDFTHVVECNTTDENYLVGLRNLIRQLRTLLECHKN